MNVSVIIPAAGLGTRMGRASSEKTGTSRKQFMLLDGQPVLMHTVRKFAACEHVREILIALRAEEMEWVGEMLAGAGIHTPVRLVEGGDSRHQSVENALAVVADDTELVAVHDAVRPFVELSIIQEAIQEAAQSGAVIVGVVPVDTVKRVSKTSSNKAKIQATLPRDKLVLAQTPQIFRRDVLRRAFQSAREDGFTGTDEASLVERLDIEVSVVLGSDRNIKITKPSDMELARLLLEQEKAR